jgi:hypothetical protein
MELTEQQKLEIMCAYLPYGIEVRADKAVYEGFTAPLVLSNNTNSFKNGYTVSTALDYGVQPILRQPDDIIEEELEQVRLIMKVPNTMYSKQFVLFDCAIILNIKEAQSALQYLHSIHIDTFGAIEAGFAIRKTN